MEQWKAIHGYEDLYEASDLGRIRKTSDHRLLKIQIDEHRHCRVFLRKNGVNTCHYVHRIIIATFEGVSDLWVHHKDGDRTNNNLNNLEYRTQSEATALAHASRREQNIAPWSSRKLKMSDVADIKRLLLQGAKQSTIARQYRVGRNLISRIARGKVWAYVEPRKED